MDVNDPQDLIWRDFSMIKLPANQKKILAFTAILSILTSIATGLPEVEDK